MKILRQLAEKHNIPEEQINRFVTDHENLPEVFDFQSIFGNNHPVILEIGCGRGELITGLAEQSPAHNFFGIELATKRIITMLKRFNPENHPNIRLLKAKVDADFIKRLPLRSIEQVIIMHPDPWPKRKHQKNRLFQAAFIDGLAQVIKANGELLVCTDNEAYAREILKCLAQSRYYRSQYDGGYVRETFFDNVQTYFERKMKKEGFIPYYMKYKVIQPD